MSKAMPQSLPDALHGCVSAGHRTPIVFPEDGVTITVAELLTAAEAYSGRLMDTGVRRGQVVGLLSHTGRVVAAAPV